MSVQISTLTTKNLLNTWKGSDPDVRAASPDSRWPAPTSAPCPHLGVEVVMIVDVDGAPVDSVVDISPLELIGLARAGELDQGGPLCDGDLLHAARVLHGQVLQLPVQLLASEVLGHTRQVGHLHRVNTLLEIRD